MTNEHGSAWSTTCSRSLRGHCLFVHIFDIIFWTVLEAVLPHGEYLRRDPSLCQHIRNCYRNITDPGSPMRHLWPRGLLKRGVQGRWESQYPCELSCIPNNRKQEQNIDFRSKPSLFSLQRPFVLSLSIQTHMFSPWLIVTYFKKTDSSSDFSLLLPTSRSALQHCCPWTEAWLVRMCLSLSGRQRVQWRQ